MDILFKGTPITTIEPKTSGAAPDFSLPAQDGKLITLSDLKKPVIISVFPDINTSTCSIQTRRFNKEAASHEEIEFLSISTNTLDEQKNWCAAEGVDMLVLSDEGKDFAKKYGILLEDGPVKDRAARAVFVVKNGEITYAQIVEEIASEPDYEKALAAAK